MTCAITPYHRTNCRARTDLRRWRLVRTRAELPTQHGRVCWTCAQRFVEATNGDYSIRVVPSPTAFTATRGRA
jgi:hypothetical protein